MARKKQRSSATGSTQRPEAVFGAGPTRRTTLVAADKTGHHRPVLVVTPSAESTQPTEGGATAAPGHGDDAEATLAGLGQARRIGRYTLLEMLGRGGMGVLSAAYDEELHRHAAR